MKLPAVLQRVVNREDLDAAEMTAVMNRIMAGEVPDAQLGALLVALRMKGETATEIAAAAAVMRRHAAFIDAGARTVIDTCGTGGDGTATFNISTTAAFIAAGAGACVAKHGNRAISSRCGSADVLAELGVHIEAEPEVMEQCLQEHGIAFLFAPTMHPAMRHVMGARKQLGLRTLFNMLGPLSNPAGATGQVLGVFAPEYTELFAQALREMGTQRALVVHGMDGMDELTVTGPSRVTELRAGQCRTYELDPQPLLGALFPPESLRGGDPGTNARLVRAVLEGHHGGGPEAVATLNAAAALVVADLAEDLAGGIALARETLRSGAALAKLECLIEASRE